MRSPTSLLLLVPFAAACAFQPADVPVFASTGQPPPSEQQPPVEIYLFRDSLTEIRFLVSTHMHMTLGPQCQVDGITLTRRLAERIGIAPGEIVTVEVMEGQRRKIDLLASALV
ncbi:MAG TPA: hypothetical protein P5291_07705, partial [Flavobacteriales bacterium]|nr:hypothetical protein [Flavobacteriales bacterium]